MKNRNESGLAHLQLIIGLVAVVGLVSFAAFRVGQSQSNNQESSDTKSPDTVQEIKVVESEEQKEVVIPEEVKEVAPAPVENKVVAKPAPAPVEKKKSEKTWLKMAKVSADQSGSVLNIVSRLPQALSGTCNFKLWQDGYEKVYSSVSISNSTDCVGQLNLAGLATYTGWELHVWFDSSDGKVSASQQEEAVVLVQP